MSIAEKYSTARNTSNLKSDPRTRMSAADVIAATGMASQTHETAVLLWEVAFKGKTSAKLKLLDLLEKRLVSFMFQIQLDGNPRRIATEVLAWHLHGVCQPCGGRGLSVIKDTPILSDDLCKHCHGSGKILLPRGEAHSWLAGEIGKLEARAAGHIMRKLASDLDFGA